MDIRTNLAELRTMRGLGAAELAAKVGISRQTVYAIEAGTYVPNTSVSLKLARALESTVEAIFEIVPEETAPDDISKATILGNSELMVSGQPLQLCSVGRQLVAVVAEPGIWGLPPADAVLLGPVRRGRHAPKGKIRVLGDRWMKSSRILLAGCDPSVSILVRAIHAHDCELLVTYENSTRSLELLRQDLVHIAGSHLIDKMTGKTDLSPITKEFSPDEVAVVSYADWAEGIVTAPNNPKGITGIADLTRKDVSFTNREQGAGCRRVLDDLLKRNGISSRKVNGYNHITVGHLPAARLVMNGEVDCCISTQAVARGLALDFIPLANKPYHLVIRREYLGLLPVQTMLDLLRRASFRREVESCTGYSMRTAGDLLA